MDHPDAEKLAALAQGTLAPGASPEVREHVSSCTDCAKEVLRYASGGSGEMQTALHGASSSPTAEVLDRGATIGRYVLLEVLGKGAVGVVYAAFDPELDRKVAIKLLQVEADGSSRGVAQAWLLREAQALAKLSHPNVTAVHDVGTVGGDRVFVAMELVEGQTLRRWKEEQPRTQREILEVFRNAGAGLAAAHAAGLVHRDFKPDNVQVGIDGRVRVLDFGLARLDRVPDLVPSDAAVHESESALEQHLTQVGQVVGTPAYMAPEQWYGQPADARADQFAFGVALYEALYGVRPFAKPFAKREADERWKISEPPPGSKVPGWLRKICVRAISEKPEARFPSMDALLAELSKDPAVARQRWLAGIAGAVVVVAALAGVRVVSMRERQLCSGAEANLAGVWDGPISTGVQAAFKATQSPLADDLFGRVRERLNRYSAAWVGMRTEACAATRLRGEQTDEVMALRMECLDQRLGELRSVTQVLVHADLATMNHSVDASAALDGLEPCADVAALRSRVKPPNEAVRTQVEAVRGSLSQAKALYDTGQMARALPTAIEALATARKLGYGPIVAEAELGVGRIQSNVSLDATKHLLEAMWAAEASRDDELFATAAVKLLLVESNFERWEDTERYRPLVHAAVERLGSHSTLRLTLAMSDCDWLAHLRKTDDAIQTGRAAVAEATRELAPDDPELGRILNAMGTTCARLNDPCALEFARQSVALREKILGPRHPDTGVAYLDLADDEARDGHSDKALEYGQHALEILRALGTKNLMTSFALGNVAEAEQNLGRLADARRDFGEVLPVLRTALGPKHPGVCEIEERGVELDLEQGLGDALSADAAQLIECRKGAEASDPGWLRATSLLAAAEIARGDAAKVTAALEANLIMQKKSQVTASDHFDVGLTELNLARAMAQSHADSARAAALLADAKVQFAAGGRAPWVELLDLKPGVK